MRYFLESDLLKVEIDSYGAEVKSVLHKKNYREYMWYGNGQVWGRTSPILFPFIGSLRDKKYTHKGVAYEMTSHGFARDMEFSLVEQKGNEIWFSIESTEATLVNYPFVFRLELGYRLEGDVLTVLWRVKNNGEDTMYFSIGAHPAFLCPLAGEADKSGYQINFGELDEVHHHGSILGKGLALHEDIVIPLENHRVTLTKEFFDRCTYFIEHKQTGFVSLETPEGKPVVTMNFDAPLFALWSPEGKNAPFFCIEPWYGRCDWEDYEGELKDRDYTNVLAAGKEFEASYTIQYHQV